MGICVLLDCGVESVQRRGDGDDDSAVMAHPGSASSARGAHFGVVLRALRSMATLHTQLNRISELLSYNIPCSVLGDEELPNYHPLMREECP